LHALQKLQKSITLKKNQGLIGSEMDILVEGTSKKGDQLTGRTGTNKVVNFNCDLNIIGDIVKVKITGAAMNSLRGLPL